MKIDCLTIRDQVLERTRAKLKEIQGEGPKVVLFYVGNDRLTDIYIAEKKRIAETLGITFEVIRWERPPLFQQFASKVRAVAHSPMVHAVIIQRPLPPELSSATMEDYIPTIKEVEGQKYKSPFLSPPGKTVLAIIKSITSNTWIIKPSDAEMFKKTFKKQFVVIAGRGITTGRPIAQALLRYKIPTIITHSKTPHPELFYRQADIIVSATGRPIVSPDNIKPGAILINFGYRTEEGKVYGDYKEREIRSVAARYTPIFNGTGPLLIAFLMENIALAYGAQMKRK